MNYKKTCNAAIVVANEMPIYIAIFQKYQQPNGMKHARRARSHLECEGLHNLSRNGIFIGAVRKILNENGTNLTLAIFSQRRPIGQCIIRLHMHMHTAHRLIMKLNRPVVLMTRCYHIDVIVLVDATTGLKNVWLLAVLLSASICFFSVIMNCSFHGSLFQYLLYKGALWIIIGQM